MYQKYVLRVYCQYKGDLSVDVVPIKEKSKEQVKTKINNSKELFEDFKLWGYDFNRSDLDTYGYEILTVSEFWGEDEE